MGFTNVECTRQPRNMRSAGALEREMHIDEMETADQLLLL